MALRIRLQRRGRRNRPFYWVVVAESRTPRDGKFVDKLGYYDPIPHPAVIDIDIDKSVEWLDKGAQPTEAARALLRKAGVLYKRYLLRGVKLQKITKEEMEKKFEEFLKRRQEKILKLIKEKVAKDEEKRKIWLENELKRYKKREERYQGKTSQLSEPSTPSSQ